MRRRCVARWSAAGGAGRPEHSTHSAGLILYRTTVTGKGIAAMIAIDQRPGYPAIARVIADCSGELLRSSRRHGRGTR